MTTSPSSGLSPEAKEFVPLVQNPPPTIPLYVDEHTIASIYPSDHQTLMVQTIYPMMITNSKSNDELQVPEIEFHIQPSQQQQFHIDSCTNIHQQNSNNRNSSTNPTSQIVLFPTTSTITSTGFYPGPQIIYSTNDSVSPFYPMDYCDQPLINFSPQQPTQITKSNRVSSQQQQQQQRPTSFRPSSRGGHHRGGGNNSNRNSYYDYNNRRNCSSYAQNSGRGNSSNSKRISSNYHSHDHNHYYHSSSRSRGYLTRLSHHQHQQQRDEHRNEHADFYENNYQQSSHMNDDGTPFEFRPEDFPSLPINNQQSDKTPSQLTSSTNNTKPISSWNAIVSAPRPHSTSPHSIPPSQDQRSDRSRSFNNKLLTNNERKPSHKKSIIQTTNKSPHRASKISSQDEQQQNLQINENNISIDDTKDDGFIQTKQQHRRLKRKNKIKEEPQTIIIESSSNVVDDEKNCSILQSSTNAKTENDSNTYHISLTEMFHTLNTSTQTKQQQNFDNNKNSNQYKLISKSDKEREQTKQRKTTKVKRINNKEHEENQNQQDQSISTVIINENQSDETFIPNQTDTTQEQENRNSNQLSSSSNNDSDTSDYDDAVDNLDGE